MDTNRKNTVDKLNVHYYDNGRLSEARNYLEEKIENISLLHVEDKKIIFDKLYDFINRKMTEKLPNDNVAKNAYIVRKNKIMTNLSLIINDFNRLGRNCTSTNYDPTNDIYACDLLLISYTILSSKEEESVLENFLEQIEDLSTGLCAQGRCCRLIQFVSVFI